MFERRRIAVADLGRMGERRAAWFYRMRGYRIAGRNVRLHHGEIDLVLRRGATVVIAEVKTRQSLAAGEGFDSVHRRKQLRLIRLADEYVARERLRTVHLRYDVLSLFWNGRRFIVTYFCDAFRPISDPHRPWLWRTG